MTHMTQTVLQHHLHAFFEGLDPLMEDFSESSTVITTAGVFQGLVAIRQFYSQMLDSLPADFSQSVSIDRTMIHNEVAYIVWHALPWFPFCTDTFVIKERKILYQTFAAFETEDKKEYNAHKATPMAKTP